MVVMQVMTPASACEVRRVGAWIWKMGNRNKLPRADRSSTFNIERSDLRAHHNNHENLRSDFVPLQAFYIR